MQCDKKSGNKHQEALAVIEKYEMRISVNLFA